MAVGPNVTRMIAAALLCGASPLLAQPAFAQQAPAFASLTPALVTAAPLPANPLVNDFYRQRGNAPIWLRDAASAEAARMLAPILERAPLDGLAEGPELARLVAAALARVDAAAPRDRPAALVAADKLLSAAWVQYVRALKAPVRGMTWGDPWLAPRTPSPHQLLADAARAPSLAAHVRSVAAVNPLYARLRDAAFQRFGPDGRPDARVLANLERARVLPASGRYIAVNAATQQLWMVEDGRIADTMKVVVGKPDTQTPLLAGTIHFATFNPYWNIPPDVARDTVAPQVLKRGADYLREARYEVVSGWSDQASVVAPETIDWKAVAAGAIEARIRQLPGPENMMGAIKFGFANELGIFLHDTPHKNLFGEERRTFSLGCVRLEDAARLGRWLLGREPVPPSGEPEQSVRLPSPVPVYITYVTAVADQGRLAFVDDFYGRDAGAGTALTALEPLVSAAGAGAASTAGNGAASDDSAATPH